MKSGLLLAFAFLMTSAGPAAGSDVTLSIDHDPVPITVKDLPPGSLINETTATVKVADAQALIARVAGLVGQRSDGAAPGETAQTPGPADRVILHVVRLTEDPKKAALSNWYLYQPDDLRISVLHGRQTQFETARLFGGRLWIVYVHLFATEQPPETKLPSVAYHVTIKSKTSQLSADFASMLEIVTARHRAGPPDNHLVGYGFAAPIELKSLPVTIDISADIGPSSSDVKQIAKSTIVDERRSYVGLSFTVPLTSYEDVTFEQTGTSFEPRTIDRQNIYATLDFYLPPADLSDATAQWVPHLLFGVPFKTQPLRHLMLGVAVGLRYVNPFTGVVFDVSEVPSATDPHQLVDHLSLKFVWGLNVPVSVVAKALGVGR